jgi:hypothetical protein
MPNEKKEKRSCSSYFLLNPEHRFLQIYDAIMLVVISYSCIMSAYFVMFEFIKDPSYWMALEHACFGFFAFDIIFNFMRQFRDIDGTFVTSHQRILSRYFMSGWLLIDLVATFPFYALGSDSTLVFKMIRLVRLPRIIRIFSVKTFKKNLNLFVRGNTRTARITSRITVRKTYSIVRLVLLALVTCYFITALFYIFVKY